MRTAITRRHADVYSGAQVFSLDVGEFLPMAKIIISFPHLFPDCADFFTFQAAALLQWLSVRYRLQWLSIPFSLFLICSFWRDSDLQAFVLLFGFSLELPPLMKEKKSETSAALTKSPPSHS